MATKKNSLTGNKGKGAAQASRSVYHSVHALLQTVRQIAQYEDALCELTHELKHPTPLSTESRKELDLVLDGMPSHVFQFHLEQARAALAGTVEPKTPTVKRVAKKVKSRGRADDATTAAAKKSRRSSLR